MIYNIFMFFILGTIFGSFYNVVGYRIPKGESIAFPASHCPECNHRLSALELIPIVSYVFLRGKCRNCHTKISLFYPIFEFVSGLLFALAYLSFGISLELIISLTFISMLIIIVLSDYHYYIIPDGVLLVFGGLLAIEIFFIYGLKTILFALLDGVISFVLMFLLKKFGDFIFKKESMGGGDIKLMFVFGMVLGWKMAVISILIGSFVGLPISLIILKTKKTHVIPFGPFLSTGALIILLTKIDFNWIIDIFKP